ncbi:MAG: hypothetical protein CMJ06_03165 [Pelagibacterales bacterium]|nr:hypothetical protein [Pelagibacterales bacterium]OUU62690.1 MAG: hypothetical protein CBC22_03410 [Alphaproteobacteria bacterium TMED62]|tara:strand:- start:19225 stop:19809 length:585 start_codon:yes stop_codon:yes gene_type:complete
MAILGRPVSLNRDSIAQASINYYWSYGMFNISYNEIIKHTKIAKGSFYKLFKDEDDLQAETLKIYFDKTSKKHFKDLDVFKDIFEMLKFYLANYNINQYCYFYVSYAESYKLGNKSKLTIKNLEKKYKKKIHNLLIRHIDLHELNIKNINVKELVSFLFDSFLLINLFKRNKLRQQTINYEKFLFKSIKKILSQ